MYNANNGQQHPTPNVSAECFMSTTDSFVCLGIHSEDFLCGSNLIIFIRVGKTE